MGASLERLRSIYTDVTALAKLRFLPKPQYTFPDLGETVAFLGLSLREARLDPTENRRLDYLTEIPDSMLY